MGLGENNNYYIRGVRDNYARAQATLGPKSGTKNAAQKVKQTVTVK